LVFSAEYLIFEDMKQSETICLRSYLCLDAVPVEFEATDRFLKDGEEGGRQQRHRADH